MLRRYDGVVSMLMLAPIELRQCCNQPHDQHRAPADHSKSRSDCVLDRHVRESPQVVAPQPRLKRRFHPILPWFNANVVVTDCTHAQYTGATAVHTAPRT